MINYDGKIHQILHRMILEVQSCILGRAQLAYLVPRLPFQKLGDQPGYLLWAELARRRLRAI